MVAAAPDKKEIMPRGIRETNVETGSGFTMLPIQQISTSIFNPRTEFDAESLQNLADSIKERGILQPITVRPAAGPSPEPWAVRTGKVGDEFGVFLLNPDQCQFMGGTPILDSYAGPSFTGYPHFLSDGAENGPTVLEVHQNWPRYEIVAGERRFRAALLAGLGTVPVNVQSLSTEDAIELAVTENMQRADLTPFEEAAGFQAMLNLPGMNQTRVAEKLGCSQSRVARVIGLLDLPEAVRTVIAQGKLSPSHGQRLLPYSKFPDVCGALAEVCVENDYPAKKLDGEILHRDLVSALRERKPPVIRALGWGTRFDWETLCKENCPYKAFRPGAGYDAQGLCLNAAHWEVLQKEADAERDRIDETKRREAINAHVARKPVTELPVVPQIAATPVLATAALGNAYPDPLAPKDWVALQLPATLDTLPRNINAHDAAVMSDLIDGRDKDFKIGDHMADADIAGDVSAQIKEQLLLRARLEAARVIILAAEKLIPTAKLPDLPRKRDMDHDSYRDIFPAAPMGCSQECPCRAIATGYGGDIVQICTNPDRIDKLIADQKKREKQERRNKAEAQLNAALAELDAAVPLDKSAPCTSPLSEGMRRAAAAAIYQTIDSVGWKFVEPAARRRGMALTVANFKSNGAGFTRGHRHAAMEELSRYSALTQLAFCAEAQFRKEMDTAVEAGKGTELYAVSRLVDFLSRVESLPEPQAPLEIPDSERHWADPGSVDDDEDEEDGYE